MYYSIWSDYFKPHWWYDCNQIYTFPLTNLRVESTTEMLEMPKLRISAEFMRWWNSKRQLINRCACWYRGLVVCLMQVRGCIQQSPFVRCLHPYYDSLLWLHWMAYEISYVILPWLLINFIHLVKFVTPSSWTPSSVGTKISGQKWFSLNLVIQFRWILVF